jgi:transcriptional regulator GlxA family with amidase domain
MSKPANSLDPPSKRIAFLLMPEFALLSYSSVTVPFQYVNCAVGRQAYELYICSVDGGPVEDTLGASHHPKYTATALPADPDIVIVCAGRNVERHTDRPLLRWLREKARRGAQMGAVSTGSYALAAAGLLDGYRATIHWQNEASFSEAFPRVIQSSSIFEIDRTRMTCSGGTAATDMALQIIAKDHGTDVALKCAEEFLHDRIRTADDLQRPGRGRALANRSQALADAVNAIERLQPGDVTLDALAKAAGVSSRHLERLFREILNTTPKRYTSDAKLMFARRMLLQSDLKIVEVAEAANFSSPSYFCQSYSKRFGLPPSAERKKRI